MSRAGAGASSKRCGSGGRVEQFARAGFTLGEIRALVCSFTAETGAAERWWTLASEKLDEVYEAIAQLRLTRDPLQEALRCECGSLDECVLLLSES